MSMRLTVNLSLKLPKDWFGTPMWRFFHAWRNDVKEGESRFGFLLTVEEKNIANQPGDDHQLEWPSSFDCIHLQDSTYRWKQRKIV